MMQCHHPLQRPCQQLLLLRLGALVGISFWILSPLGNRAQKGELSLFFSIVYLIFVFSTLSLLIPVYIRIYISIPTKLHCRYPSFETT
ncbi:hypothetical protein F9C07_1664336 [Aspergillus flavus]|uniref:Uncharacterized protein n=2 Tax=Aspergillus flavus TaxID=5059 RepID=A0A7U2QVC5_ASPFN|nr:hypothetical protein BDV35DRAFT_16707 [Aspergillus flavus]QRD84220.1 hypothetical protein F9C07_1664336 [Aspergillus flavus]